jgi:hypothetical protein
MNHVTCHKGKLGSERGIAEFWLSAVVCQGWVSDLLPLAQKGKSSSCHQLETPDWFNQKFQKNWKGNHFLPILFNTTSIFSLFAFLLFLFSFSCLSVVTWTFCKISLLFIYSRSLVSSGIWFLLIEEKPRTLRMHRFQHCTVDAWFIFP